MTEIERQYFCELHKDRSESADTLEKPSMRGVKKSVVEKYSDQAHFIYELLQNADDAGATSARFTLYNDKLVFAHNGTRYFSVSNPETEEEDSERGKLGDLNAITSIANSNKTESSIGKFGVGFKAVFQYTSSPHIYDPHIKFRIDRFIVPSLLDEDYEGRREDETLFVFPFDNPNRTALEAYEDIADKLRNLMFPILFLSRLKDISYEIDEAIGLYGKKTCEKFLIDNTSIQKLQLTNNEGEEFKDQFLWLFSRADEKGRVYSVVFFLDAQGQLKAVNEPAFCFFSTKEVTGLKFLIHAPFLLTDSREGIKAGELHNKTMIALLAKLAADSFVYLRDIGTERSVRLINDDILDMIPIDESAFNEVDDKKKISFKPFFTEIQKCFETEKLLPTIEGYTWAENAYWADVPQLTKLFSNQQLAQIAEDYKAEWVFTSIGRKDTLRKNKELSNYIDSITKVWLDEDDLIDGWSYTDSKRRIEGIGADFIENQSIEWLHEFYKWLSETKHRTEAIEQKSVFLDQDGNAVAAYDDKHHLILFLPVDGVEGYKTVNEALLKNEETRAFIEKIGVKAPSIKDQIYNFILPQYKTGKEFETSQHFLLFFNYYRNCTHDEQTDFIDEIQDIEFLSYYTQADSQQHRGKASDLYFPDNVLVEYFETKPTTKFLAFDEYKLLVGISKETKLRQFFVDLGVRESIAVYKKTLSWSEQVDRGDLPRPQATYSRTYTETIIDGCVDILEYIQQNQSKEKSKILWEQLLYLISNKCSYRGLEGLLQGTCSYFYYSSRIESYEPADVIRLKSVKWLMNKNGEFVSAQELLVKDLADIYDTKSDEANKLIEFLGIAEEVEEEEDDSLLSDSQKEQLLYGKLCQQSGITYERLQELIAEEKRKQNTRTVSIAEEDEDTYEDGDDNDDDGEELFLEDDIEDLEDVEENDDFDDEETEEKKRKETPVLRVVKDIVNKTKSNSKISQIPEEDMEDVDSDELLPSTVDFAKKAEAEKQKAAKVIEKLVHQEEVQQRALNATRYSYAWFKALLELESLSGNSNSLDSKEVSISFARVEREPGTQRTLILKQPNRYIPQFMEDLTDIPLVLCFEDQTKNLAIEVANIKSYTLRVKLKSHVDLGDLDLTKVMEARIEAKSPVFLLEELKREFYKLEYEDDFNMQENLCENIEFVFGPPGTGKTTHLARNIILPFMKGKEDLKVLVLTPTNKSADVLVRRIMEVMGGDKSYVDWLIRFGGTGDEVIEQSGVYKDKTFDIRTLKKCVTVSTIARFPYDFFMPSGTRLFLNGLNWDYIIIDEASMIPIANIIYPLYKKTPRKFIIAGDPFQIEPITAIDLWKDENIYTLVHLDSFIDPQTIPHSYKVELLTTQYRSIPSIGSVFSGFAYGGILEHFRGEESQRKLGIEKILNIKALNIIKFPVSKYESIYKPKRLQHSSAYQIYSALFTFEFIQYLSNLIAEANPGKCYKIGVIAPYRAQADLIEKLINSAEPTNNVEVQIGTIHGFQGDECDIVFAVYNTPPSISTSKDMFLNKRNIINVSISRAKDYLFIIMPDDDTENINNLKTVKRIEQLFKATGKYAEFKTADLERCMFGNDNYLEENAFSTGHQDVNVYGLPEKYYEIRSEESAVDVQIHKQNRSVSTIPKVYNKKYGEGIIIERRTKEDGKVYITVQYAEKTINYDEEYALSIKAIQRI